MKLEIKNRFSGLVILCGEYESIRDCLQQNKGAYLQDAYLRDADLRDADLRGAYLRGADLRDADLQDADLQDADLQDADLQDAKNYFNSHDFLQEIIKRQTVSYFTKDEWSEIGQVLVHKFCYSTIRNKYPNMEQVFKKLADKGFGEYYENKDNS